MPTVQILSTKTICSGIRVIRLQLGDIRTFSDATLALLNEEDFRVIEAAPAAPAPAKRGRKPGRAAASPVEPVAPEGVPVPADDLTPAEVEV